MAETIRKNDIYVLGIETSCDETAASVVKNGREVLSNIISSQVDTHTLYGGVVPEIASRLHIESINGVIRLALREAFGEEGKDCPSCILSRIDAIAVTMGPGLVGALLVGVAEAKAMAWALNKPLVGVNHIEGHIAANYLTHPSLEPPYICLTVSGGHTHLTVVKSYTGYETIGRTHDDAAGETFDKVARAMGLGYPGGPKVDKAAEGGNPRAVAFPRGEIKGCPYDFTFSGLKSAVLGYLNQARMKGEDINIPDLAASFEAAVVEPLVERTVRCALERGAKTVAMAGGVSANTALRKALYESCAAHGISCCYPEPMYCTDNAAMIAAAGYYRFMEGRRDGTGLNAVPYLTLGL